MTRLRSSSFAEARRSQMTDPCPLRRSCETTSILTPKQGIQIVLVLVLETDRLRSFEHEDETANELIETALILRSFFSDQTGCPLAGGRRSCETL